MELDEYAMLQVFHPVFKDGETIAWYRETVDEDAWLVVWPDGNHLHTYKFPLDWLLDDPSDT
jgi:hypothetical protein